MENKFFTQIKKFSLSFLLYQNHNLPPLFKLNTNKILRMKQRERKKLNYKSTRHAIKDDDGNRKMLIMIHTDCFRCS